MTPGRTLGALLLATVGCSTAQPFTGGIAILQVIVPQKASVYVDSTIQLQARAIGAAGDTLANVTFSWSTPDTTIRVNATTGQVTGVLANTVGRVQVSADSVASDLITLTVLPAPVDTTTPVPAALTRSRAAMGRP